MQISVDQLEELLGGDTPEPGEEDSSPNASLPQFSERCGDAVLLNGGAPTGIFFPIVVNGSTVAVPLDGSMDPTNWDAMSPANRRSVLGYGFTAAAASVLGAHDATQAQHRVPLPWTLPAPAHQAWATATYNAVLNPMDAVRQTAGSADDGVHDPQALRAVIDRAMHVSLTSDYWALEQSLPTLIGRVEAATRYANGECAALQALSDVYAVVGWTLIKADNVVGAWLAAQRAIQAAEQAEDLLRIAAATRCLAEVHMRAKNFEEATRTAFLAAVQLEGASPEGRQIATSLRGAALLSAASASARRGDSREAHAALQAAAGCAAKLGQDRSDLATVFGPTNVAIHQVAIPIELGDAHGALRRVPAVRLEQMPKPLTERRARFLIDVARTYAHLEDDAAAIDALIQAETIATDELRYHRLTHELIPQLLARENRTSELRALALRCNLLN